MMQMGAPIPLLVLPGHLCNRRLFTHQIRQMGDVADIVVADLYGADTVQDLAETAIVAMPRQFAVLANSMGGSVAFEVMRQAPERVLGLALVGTTARPEWPAQNARRQPAAKLAAQGDFKSIAEMYAPVFFHPDRTEDGVHVHTLESMITEAGDRGLRNQQKAFANRPDSRPDLKNIRCPTLVLCGRDDVITPLEMSEEIAEGISGAELEVLETCGHIPMLEWPEQTTDLLRRWLDRI
jgi:pimeloyl-ACP methyl ester carboxylesterase